MSSNPSGCCFQNEDEVPQTMEDVGFLSTVKCEGEADDAKCAPSSEYNGADAILPPYSIKEEPENSEYDYQVREENAPLKDEGDIEEHKPGYELLGRSKGEIFTAPLDRFDPVKRSELRSSSKSESEEKAKHNCGYCPYKTNDKSDYVRHYVRNYRHQYNIEIHKCAECSFGTRYKTALTRHIKTKHAEEVEMYKCDECSFASRYKKSLTNHLKYQHSPDELEVYKCPECSFETTFKGNLNKHYKQCKRYEKAEVYKCQECEYETRRRGDLTKHYKVKHAKEAEMYKCGACPYEAKQRGYLTIHRKYCYGSFRSPLIVP